ncbi:alpha-tubulin suppressor-like RCC1 family protein [Longimicrobium terrae]|uniref:Alpha-tubulin suppressor-like RCC1 family protein n=2 Tax=Longimicrobium terrae TaxID=1639882 RepID=A0A841GVY8_9BACT|nr:alpha-tubulin suppressor-like RCC1 family protein [Longimicrobium terrae]MBB6070048.1 alpha-tubulin suppressor-like RCC1 family protein [Longimicrobium terrae]
MQNLLAVALATTDGVQPSPTGVRVFFVSGPTNGATIANPDGSASFTDADQAYFQYSALGGDGILAPAEISEGKVWRFAANGAASFTFSVYVQADAGVTPETPPYLHFTQISGGSMHTCGLTDAGAVYCWGSDMSGQQGDGDAYAPANVPSPIAAPAGVRFTTTSSDKHYTCALTTDDHIYCWGYGPGEMSSVGEVPFRISRPAGVRFVRIAPATSHACALDQEGAAYCWGGNGAEQLGTGSSLPFEAMTPIPVAMPPGIRFTEISASGEHTCALTAGGDAYCWGYADHGQLGVGFRIFSSATPLKVVRPNLNDGFTAIAAGDIHTCALVLSGKAYCWGAGWLGQIGDGIVSEASRYAPTEVAMPLGVTFVSISAGTTATCALGTNGKGYCWGLDEEGQLGNGPATSRIQWAPSEVVMPTGTFFTGISAAASNGCAVTAGPAYCWGQNRWSAVGDGTDVFRHVPVAVAGSR